MPIPPEYQQLLIERHEAAEREARRATRADLVRTLRDVLVWTAVGLVFIGFAWHVGDAGYGWVLWWIGAIAWFGGVGFSLLAAYRRGELRGDW